MTMMTDSLEQALDRCLDRINAGEAVEACLADYPRLAAELDPLLRAALQTRETYSFTPSAEAKQSARQRFAAAREQIRVSAPVRRRGPLAFLARPLVWGPALAVIVALLVTFLGVQPALGPGTLPIVPVASASGNFAFLISDDVNAIADFVSVNATFSRIGLLDSASGKWLEINPEVTSVDLTRVQGNATEQVWRGDVPTGEYRRVFVYIDTVSGVLKADGRTVSIKLPSNKLHIDAPFAVADDTVTSFTFDITVVKAGSGRGNVQYILKPVVNESGARQSPTSAQNDRTADDRTRPTPHSTVPATGGSKPPKK